MEIRGDGTTVSDAGQNVARNTATPLLLIPGVTAPDGFPPKDTVPVVSRMTSET